MFRKVEGVPSAAPAPTSVDVPPELQELADEFRKKRIPYCEIREMVEIEEREKKVCMDIVGKEMRAKCVAEIDEYADCIVGRTFTLFQCKPKALDMRRCLVKYETPEFVTRRMEELLSERKRKQGSLPDQRALHNKCFIPEDPASVPI